MAKFNQKSPKWTVPQLSIMIIYNCTWSILIQQIRIIMSGGNLTQKTQKNDRFTSLHRIKENLPHWAYFYTFKFVVLMRQGGHWCGIIDELLSKTTTYPLYSPCKLCFLWTIPFSQIIVAIINIVWLIFTLTQKIVSLFSQ